jgi:hypothetical protein
MVCCSAPLVTSRPKTGSETGTASEKQAVRHAATNTTRPTRPEGHQHNSPSSDSGRLRGLLEGELQLAGCEVALGGMRLQHTGRARAAPQAAAPSSGGRVASDCGRRSTSSSMMMALLPLLDDSDEERELLDVEGIMLEELAALHATEFVASSADRHHAAQPAAHGWYHWWHQHHAHSQHAPAATPHHQQQQQQQQHRQHHSRRANSALPAGSSARHERCHT